MDLTREAILGADDVKIVPVDVEEWGGRVYVRVMDGASLGKWRAENVIFKGEGKSRKGEPNVKDAPVRLAALTICDGKGVLLFSEEDLIALGKKSGRALERIVEAATKLNGLGEDDVEEEVGNS